MSTPLRVLFLDDDGCDALAITNELRGAGFSPDFVRVETEEQYLKELDRTYELILAENDLPRLNVSRALHRLKELDLDIPFIVIAGNGGEEAVAEWMRKGAADYLVKDRLARLGPSVVRALGDKRLRDHKRWSNVALKNSEKRLRAMIENSSDGISLLDADATMVYTSPAITRILGYGVDELVGCNMLDWMHPDDVERVGSIFKALIKHPSESVAIDFHYKHKDGSWRWMESVVTNLVAEPSVQALVLNYRDITERKRADEERERVTLQLAALVATSLAINARTDLDSLLPIIIRRAADLLQAGMGALFFSDSERLDLELVVGYNIPTSLLGTKLKRSEGVAGCVAESGEPLTVTDYSSWPGRTPAMSAVVLGRVQGVPLRARGHIIGVLEIMDGKPGSFAPDEIRLVSVFADQAAIAIDNARLLAEKDRRADEFAALYQSSSDLAAQHELPELLKTIMHSAARLLRAPGSSLYLYDSEHDELVLQEVCNLPVPTGTRLKMGEGHAGMVAQTRQPLIVADYATSPLRSPRFGDVAITSALQVPILFGGDLIGVLAVHHTTKTTEFTQADQRLLSLFAIQVASAVHNAQLFRESMHRAEQLAALNSAALTVQQQFDPMEIYRQAANELQHLGHMASIFRIDDGQLTHVRTAMPVESPYQLPDHTRRLDGGITLPPEAAAPILARLATGETAIDRQLVSQVIPRLPARLQTTAERVLAEVGSDAVLVAPLMRGAQPIGVMLVVGQHLDDSDVLAVSLFARHISSALENARLFAEMRRQQEQLSVVNRIASAVNGTLDLDELLALVHEQLSAALAFDAFFVALYDAASDELDFRIHIDDGVAQPRSRRPRSLASFTSYVISTRRPLLIHDWDKEKQEYPAPILFGNMRAARTWMGVPLLVGDSVVGVISVQAYHPNAYLPEEEQLVATVAEQVAVAIEKAWLFEAEQTSRQELAALYDLSRDLTDILDVDATLHLIARRAVETIHVSFARVVLCEGADFIVRAAYPERILDRSLAVGRHDPVRLNPIGQRAMDKNAPLVITAASQDLQPQEREAWLLDVARTVCLVPMRLGDRALGLLMLGEVRREEREPFTTKKIRLAHGVADQAASALHRAILRDKSQRDAAELAQAYEATIEGWSRALDQRDKETEGHTQRVATAALRLAKAVGMTADELVHLRRGALLHDIGKMAIPDRILLKPGPLTPAEWDIMRKHPVYAYDLLSPISYLRRALDIPYCHHEKWDGTGYPRGLKGEQIPLAARVFAIVDVWDALRSDRPYRAAWSEPAVRKHLAGLGGTHFDPQVLAAFMRIVDETP